MSRGRRDKKEDRSRSRRSRSSSSYSSSSSGSSESPPQKSKSPDRRGGSNKRNNRDNRDAPEVRPRLGDKRSWNHICEEDKEENDRCALGDLNDVIDLLAEDAPREEEGPGGVPLDVLKVIIKHLGCDRLTNRSDEQVENAAGGSGTVCKKDVLSLLAPAGSVLAPAGSHEKLRGMAVMVRTFKENLGAVEGYDSSRAGSLSKMVSSFIRAADSTPGKGTTAAGSGSHGCASASTQAPREGPYDASQENPNSAACPQEPEGANVRAGRPGG